MGESFVVLPSAELRGEGGDADASVMARIFDIASDLSDMDHPLCYACSSSVVAEIERRTKEAEAECAEYEETLEALREAEEEEERSESRGIDGRTSGRGGVTKVISHAVRDMEKAEREAEETLRALEIELESTRATRSKLAKKAAALDEAENTYWREFHAFKKNLHAHLEKRDSIVARTEQAQTHLERLEKTNVFNDAFHIWRDGAFGTINGFRLGRLPATVVEWEEINTAFGLVCLLLHSIPVYFCFTRRYTRSCQWTRCATWYFFTSSRGLAGSKNTRWFLRTLKCKSPQKGYSVKKGEDMLFLKCPLWVV